MLHAVNHFAKPLRMLSASLALSVFTASAQAPADIRIALVIGNAAYAGNAALANPANDARAMGETLKQLGFNVVEVRDGSKAQMTDAVAKVRDTLKGKQGIGMLYYAGHGLQLDWRNYMVPVDAKLGKASDVAEQTVDLNSVIDAFKLAGNRMNIVVLDACRDNPFAGSAASGKGLAQLDAPPGTFLAYATAPGNVAEDGDAKSGNGLYTQYLLEELKKPTAKIEDVFKRVRLNVRKQSQGRQVPWESTSLEDDFVFNDGTRSPTPGDPAARMPKVQDRQAAERQFQMEKTEWDKIKDGTDLDVVFTFLQKYPSGFLSETAQFRLDQLQAIRVTAQPGKDGVTPLPSGVRRWHLGDQVSFETTDGLTRIKERETRQVASLLGDKVIFADGENVLDQMGGVLKSKSGIFSPAILTAPADLALGKKWRSAFQQTTSSGLSGFTYLDYAVVALEDVQLMGRGVKVFRVSGRGFFNINGGGSLQLEQSLWIDPSTMRVVRTDRLYRGNGRIFENSSTLMVDSVSAKR